MTGGRLRGRTLRAPRGRKVRPTSDRVREAMFARLPGLEGALVVDLCAGSGALGIEALSRGATSAVFVDRAAASLEVLRRNLKSLELEAASRVLRAEAGQAVARLGREGLSADLVLLDPPYAAEGVPDLMRAVVRAGILGPDGLLILESAVHSPPGDVQGLALVDERRYGDTLLLRFIAGATDAGDENECG